MTRARIRPLPNVDIGNAVRRAASIWWLRETGRGLLLAVLVPFALRTLFAADIVTRKSFGGFVLMVVGLLLATAGVLLYAWWLTSLREDAQAATARAEHDPAPHFDLGPYAYTRNPSRLALVALVLAQALWLAAPWLTGYALLLAIAEHARVIWWLEPQLHARYPAAYADWSRAVPRWLPWRALGHDAREIAETAWRLARRR